MDVSHGLTFSSLALSATMGLISFASPCILPLIPSYVSYITGISYDELTGRESRRETLSITVLHSLAFIAGFTIIFVALGASASFAGNLLAQHLDTIRIAGGALVVLMGIFVMDVVNIPFLQREARMSLKTRPAGYLGTVAVGMVFGAGWTPCTGPFLGSVLALAMTAETLGRGMVLLTFYSLGLGVPFLLSAIAISAFLTSFNRVKKYLKAIKIASGAVLVIMGVLLMLNKMTILIIR
jgi:cytochrome c-type biogenesis protein